MNRAESSQPVERPTGRREFMTLVAVTGLGAMASSTLAGSGLTPTPTPTPAPGMAGVPTDGATQFSAIPGRNINEKVLNFALTLEILEADLYRQALNLASGKALTAPLNSNPGVYSRTVGAGGMQAPLTDVGYLYLKQFAYVEAAHRNFLTSAIQSGGGVPVQRNPRGYRFPAGLQANMASILGNLLPLEETGVRAYLGALNYLTDLNLAVVAGGIFSTEARHSAAVAYTLGIDAGPRRMPGDIAIVANQPSDNTFEYYLKPQAVLSAASAYFA